LIDHYEADVMTAQDYYPFGMIMPGRMYISLQVPGGSVTGTTQVNGYTVPVDLTLNSRTGDKPSEYVATQFIDLVEGFESGDSTDVVTAYLTDTSYAGTGNGGTAADEVVAGQGKYRYGFNGQEKSDEIKGAANSYTAEFWEYDPRIGRRWNVDPKTKDFESPYSGFANNPIWLRDENGADTTNPMAGLIGKIDNAFGGVAKNQQKVQLLRAGIKNQVEEIARNSNLKAKASDGMVNASTAAEFKANLNLYSAYDKEIQEHTQALSFLIGALYQASNDKREIKKYNEFINTELNLALYGANAALTAVSFLPTAGSSGLFSGVFVRATGERVFWSGGMEVAGQAAQKFSLDHGLETLEMTWQGRALSFVDRMFSGGAPSRFTYKIWGGLSRNWARGAEGAAHIFHNPNGIRLGSQWSKFEYPILKQKGIQLIFH
jgi:hypothetical protein